ncbi:MAG: RHS repeat protein [Candidatus Schekmanbacteria bacterium]|nr:RHS repeat protein [Candidatus Schekmanbacteria bacterium]
MARATSRQSSATPGTRTTTLAYDSRRKVAALTDPLGRITAFTYDQIGRPTSITASGGRRVALSWDVGSNVTSVTPPDREAHAFTYTPVDLAASYDPPAPDATAEPGANGWKTNATYDLDRRPVVVTDAEGRTLRMVYDTSGRPARAELPDSRAIAYGYDPDTGQLAEIAGPDGTALAMSWDGALPLGATWTGTVTGSVEVTWDDDFRLVSRRVNGNNETAFSYDADGFLTGAGPVALARDPASGFLNGTAVGAVTDSYTYDSYGDVAAHAASVAGAGDPIYAVTIDRDDLGRIRAMRETVQGEAVDMAYAYDEAGRLASATEDGAPAASWTYDANGNRTSETTPAGTIAASYDGQDRLVAYGDSTYTFGAAGQLAGKTGPEGTAGYVYDVLGNLRAVSLPGGTEIAYEVDGSGRRIAKKVDGVRERAWLYQDALEPVAELDGAGAVVSIFVYASRHHVPDAMIRGGTTYRLLSDPRGSVRLVVDAATGAVAQRLDYDAWGRVVADTNPGFQPFGFAGGLYDPDTGLVRFGARDYDAVVGRWTARDSIGFGGGDTNLFAYVGNDPVNRIDPSGYSPTPTPGPDPVPLPLPTPMPGCSLTSIWVCERPIDDPPYFLPSEVLPNHKYVCCDGENSRCYGHQDNNLAAGKEIPGEQNATGECEEKQVCLLERELKCNNPVSPCNAGTLTWNCRDWADWDGTSSCGFWAAP